MSPRATTRPSSASITNTLRLLCASSPTYMPIGLPSSLYWGALRPRGRLWTLPRRRAARLHRYDCCDARPLRSARRVVPASVPCLSAIAPHPQRRHVVQVYTEQPEATLG